MRGDKVSLYLEHRGPLFGRLCVRSGKRRTRWVLMLHLFLATFACLLGNGCIDVPGTIEQNTMYRHETPYQSVLRESDERAERRRFGVEP